MSKPEESADAGSSEPRTGWEAEGSIVDRLRGTPTEGAPGQNPAAEAAVARAGGAGTTHGGPSSRTSSATTRRAGEEPGSGSVGPAAGQSAERARSTARVELGETAPRNPRAERRAERLIALLFGLSSLAVVAFAVVFWAVSIDNVLYTPLLGLALFVVLFCVGAAAILWAKKLMPEEEAVQERHPLHSSEEDAAKTAAVFAEGTEATGIKRRRLLRWSFLGAMGTLALPLIPVVSELTPRYPPKGLSQTPWRRGLRLVSQEGVPFRIGDLAIGGVATVFPEGHNEGVEAQAYGATLLIRLRPGENQPRPGREDWAVEGHVAYSAVCTHAGCPAKLYEQQTSHLLCPCHQSTFLVPDGCRPIFGPAARSLPQLAIGLDADGYFVAKQGFTEPIGPSFWERG